MLNRQLKKIFSLILPSSSAAFEDPMVGPNLSPFINRDKINSFCSDFNKATKIYKENIDLYTSFFLYNDGSFFFKVRGPKLFHLLNFVLEKKLTYKKVSLFDFYDIIYLKSFFYLKSKKYNDLFLKKQMLINFYSVKNLILYNDIYYIEDGSK